MIQSGSFPITFFTAFEREDLSRGYAVVLSHRLWQSTLGGDAKLAGSTVNLDQRACMVLPAGIRWPRSGTRSTTRIPMQTNGGGARNVLEVFPTMLDPKLRLEYSPAWDFHLVMWPLEVVAKRQ